MAKAKRSPMVEAAEALDEELQRFEVAARACEKAPLKSQRHIEKAAKQLEAITEFEEPMRTKVEALVAAVSAARERQMAQAEQMTKVAQRLQERTVKLQELLNEYADLGTDAAKLNQTVQALAERRKAGESATLATDVDALFERMTGFAERAEALAGKAREAEFDDVEEKADSLRQQLLAVRNKVALLRKQLGAST